MCPVCCAPFKKWKPCLVHMLQSGHAALSKSVFSGQSGHVAGTKAPLLQQMCSVKYQREMRGVASEAPLMGGGAAPALPAPFRLIAVAPRPSRQIGNAHMRSSRSVRGQDPQSRPHSASISRASFSSCLYKATRPV